MPPRKKPKADDPIGDLIQSTVATVLGPENRESVKDITLSRGGGSSQAQEYMELVRKVPKLEPESLRRFFAYCEMFFEFLENKDSTLLPISAKVDKLIDNLCLWLYDVVIQSEGRLGFKETLDDQGRSKKLLLAASTLQSYRMAAQTMLRYAVPAPTALELIDYKNKIGVFTNNLIKDYDLARPPLHSELIGPSEVRLIVEYLLKEQDSTSDMELQACVFTLMLLFMGVRRGTLLSTSAYPNTFATFRDFQLGPSRDDQGVINGINLVITLRHWKGHRYQTRYLLKYRISPLKKRKNIILELPLFFFAHAYRNGVLEGSENHWRTFFNGDNQQQFWNYKQDRQDDPIFYRSVPKGTGLNHAAPMSADQFGRYMRTVLQACGVRSATDGVVNLYCFRKDFLTRMTQVLGDEMAALLAGHVSGTRTLWKHYVRRQDVSVAEGVEEGETGIEEDSLQINRATAAPKLTVQQLIELDPELCLYLSCGVLLDRSLSLRNHGWKNNAPFSLDADRYRSLGFDEAALLRAGFKRLSRSRLETLRRAEINGNLSTVAKPPHPNYISRLNRKEEGQDDESDNTKKYELKVLTAAYNEIGGMGDEAVSGEEVEELRIDDGDLVDEESEDDSPGILSDDGVSMATEVIQGQVQDEVDNRGIWQMKLSFLERLLTRPLSTGQTCPICQTDNTVSFAEKARIWQPYKLKDSHLANIAPGDPYPLSSRAYHSDAATLVRHISNQGWYTKGKDGAGTIWVTCSVPLESGRPCATKCRTPNLFKHLFDKHLAHFDPPFQGMVTRLGEDAKGRREEILSNYKESRNEDSHITVPAANYHAIPILPATYQLDKPDETSNTVTCLHQIMNPSFTTSFPTMHGDQLIPDSSNGLNETEAYLLERLKVLSIDIPGGLYDDQLNLMIDKDSLITALDAFDIPSEVSSVLKDGLNHLIGQETEEEGNEL